MSFLVFYLANLRAAARAESFLQAISRLRVGESTEQNLDPIIRRYGGDTRERFAPYGCPNVERREHSVRIVRGDPTDLGRRVLFGNKVWYVDGYFASSQGRVCYVRYRLFVAPRNTNYGLNLSGSLLRDTAIDGTYNVSFNDIHNVQRLSSYITQGATEEQRKRAFDFNLSCLSSLEGCRTASEMMPSVWFDYEKKAQENGWDLPSSQH